MSDVFSSINKDDFFLHLVQERDYDRVGFTSWIFDFESAMEESAPIIETIRRSGLATKMAWKDTTLLVVFCGYQLIAGIYAMLPFYEGYSIHPNNNEVIETSEGLSRYAKGGWFTWSNPNFGE